MTGDEVMCSQQSHQFASNDNPMQKTRSAMYTPKSRLEK
jgi:hypothetical protein